MGDILYMAKSPFRSVFCYGLTLSLTDTKLLVSTKTAMMGGDRYWECYLNNIDNFFVGKGLLSCELVVYHDHGMVSKTTFKYKSPEFDILFKVLREKIDSNHNDKLQETKTNTENSDYIEELTKLADLKTKGIITNEEFEAKKRQLLGLK